MEKKILSWLLFAALLFMPAGAGAQVTIGSDHLPSPQSLLDLDASTVKKALHLPRLTATERDALTVAEKSATRGLAIYNIDNKCYEYWNETKWISLCTGAADIRLEGGSGLIGSGKFHSWKGVEEEGPILPVETPEPSCGIDPPLSIIVISGSMFLSVDMIEPISGLFTYTLNENTSYNPRTAVIRVLDNCTQEYKDFFVNQEGNTSVCDGRSGTPLVNMLGSGSVSEGKVCAGGQSILTVANVSAVTVTEYPNDFVWTRNGIEVGRGLTFYATQPGRYQLFLGGVGCPNKSDITNIVWQDTPIAPKPVLAIGAQNNGMVCNGDPIMLTAITAPGYANPPESVQWLKNGDLGATGVTIGGITTIGDIYSAVVVNSTTGCVSRSSNELLIREGTGSKPLLTAAGVLVNGVTMSSNPPLCPGSTIKLEVGSPHPDLIYEWFINAVSVGTGSIVFYAVPPDASQLILQCVVSGTGCIASVTFNGDLTAQKPARPVIDTSSSFVCAASTLTLSASYRPEVTYQWFRNGTAIAGQTGNTLNISNAGSFEVQAAIGACLSERSAARDITLSGAPTSVVFSVAPATGIPDSTIPFLATGVNAESWTWSSDGRVSANDNSAEYSWSAAGQKIVTATARNACGTTPVTAQIAVEFAEMDQPVVIPVAVSDCGGGAQYKIDIDTYPDADILTGFNWTVTRSGVPITYQTLGEKGSILQFQYTEPGAVPYTVQAVARGVGKKNSVPSTILNSTPLLPKQLPVKLRGSHIFDVAKTGSDLALRVSNIVAGSSYPYSIYDGGGTPNSNGQSSYNFPVFAGATYLWATDDNNGLLVNADMINGATSPTVSLTFSEAINSITDGQRTNLMLSCVVMIEGCPYPVAFPIVVQDKFACGTGSYPTKLMGTTVPYGMRTSQRSYDTYTFPTSDTDPTPKCWMITDSAEGTNSHASIPSTCRNGGLAQQTDGGQGFHYWSSTTEKESACPPGWRLPVGGGTVSAITNTTEMGNHFRNLQAWNEYKAMWYKNYTVQHGYNCTAVYGAWSIWMLQGRGADDHEAWLNRTTLAVDNNGDASHQAFPVRCVKIEY